MRVRMLGQHVNTTIAVLSIVEATLFFVAVYWAVLTRSRLDLSSLLDLRQLREPLWLRATLFSGIMVICLLAFGLYSPRQRARFKGIALRLAMALAAGLAITMTLFSLVPALWIGGGVILLAAIGGLLGVTVSRAIFSRLLDEAFFKRRVLVFGAGDSAATIAGLRRRADRRGFSVMGFVPAHPRERAVAADRLIESDRSLARVCKELEIEEVVVAMDDRRSGFPVAALLECRLSGIDVTELLTFLERETGCVRVDLLNPSWLIFGQGFRQSMLRRVSARAFDLSTSFIVLVLALPVMLLTVLGIKLEDGWRAPVLYRQRRVGLHGRSFTLLKFRSMRTDAERDGLARWAQKRDSRITRIGSVIRRTRVDELPQLLNVLGGQMSVVGPRPERPEFVADLAERIPYYVERHCVKPGLTGWAQLCYPYGSSERDALEKLQYDLYYIKNNSLLFDTAILLQTVEVVLLGKGAR